MMKSEAVLLLLILVSNILITGSVFPLIYIAAALLHECGHLLTIYALGYRIAGMKFMGIGIRIKSRCIFSYRQEIVIGAMGPITNFVIAAVCTLLTSGTCSELLNYFIMANIMYAFVNLIPLAPLDGYRIVSNALYLKISYRRAEALMRVIMFILTGFMIVLLILMFCRNSLNLSFVFILIALIINSILQCIKS